MVSRVLCAVCESLVILSSVVALAVLGAAPNVGDIFGSLPCLVSSFFLLKFFLLYIFLWGMFNLIKGHGWDGLGYRSLELSRFWNGFCR